MIICRGAKLDVKLFGCRDWFELLPEVPEVCGQCHVVDLVNCLCF